MFKDPSIIVLHPARKTLVLSKMSVLSIILKIKQNIKFRKYTKFQCATECKKTLLIFEMIFLFTALTIKDN